MFEHRDNGELDRFGDRDLHKRPTFDTLAEACEFLDVIDWEFDSYEPSVNHVVLDMLSRLP